MKPFFLLAMIFLISACAAPTSVPPTATWTPTIPTATLEPSSTATQSAPTEAVPTATEGTGAVEIPAYLREIPILTEAPRSLAEIPRVQMADIESGAFAEALRQAYLDGRIEPFGDDVPVFSFSLVDQASSAVVRNYGFGPLYRGATFGKPHQDMPVGIYIVVDDTSRETAIFPQLLRVGKNDSDVRVLVHIFPLSGDAQADLKWVDDSWDAWREPAKLVVPAYFRDEAGCQGMPYAHYIDACQDFVRNDQDKFVKLVKQWKASGEFPKALETILIFSTPQSFK